MNLEINRDAARWVYDECFPLMVEMAIMNVKIHDNRSVDYWNNKIVMYTLRQVREKFRRKLMGTSNFFKIQFEDAEGYCLYRFLFNFPIDETHDFKIQQRQFIINQLHKQMIEPESMKETEIHQ